MAFEAGRRGRLRGRYTRAPVPTRAPPLSPRNPVEHDILPALQARWSPYAFDPERDVSEGDLAAMFEAARWAMSSYNEQPWRFIVGVRGRSEETREKVLGTLVEGNKPWATFAPVLALGLYRPDFARNGKPNAAARHDLGAASACLTVEAAARGIMVHQMIGVDHERVRAAFELPDGLEPLTALAIGYHAPNPGLDESYAKRDERERSRLPLGELLLAGGL